MIDEGYIKFNSDWEKQAAFEDERLDELLRYRQLLYGLELIGAYPDGIGYGNISLRLDATRARQASLFARQRSAEPAATESDR